MEIAATLFMRGSDVITGWRRLHSEHALVLDAQGDRLIMLNPFAAVPTAHVVTTPGRMWTASCPWDAFGICSALHEPGTIETPCPDCGEVITIENEPGAPLDDTLLFHSLLPASRWWDDIVFT
ncbi:MAG: organomercurial lyase [Candidatus Dormibacteria bacterium]